MTRVTCQSHFENIIKHLIDKKQIVCANRTRFFASVMNDIGVNFLFSLGLQVVLCCISDVTCVTFSNSNSAHVPKFFNPDPVSREISDL